MCFPTVRGDTRTPSSSSSLLAMRSSPHDGFAIVICPDHQSLPPFLSSAITPREAAYGGPSPKPLMVRRDAVKHRGV
jgi:hypothetical protein